MDQAVIKFVLQDEGGSVPGGTTQSSIQANSTDGRGGDTAPGAVEAASRRSAKALVEAQIPEAAAGGAAGAGPQVARELVRALENVPVFGQIAAAMRAIAEPLLRYAETAGKLSAASAAQVAAAVALREAVVGAVAAADPGPVLAEPVAERFDPSVQGPPRPAAQLPEVQGPPEPGGPWKGQARPGEVQGPPVPPVLAQNDPNEWDAFAEPGEVQGPPKPPVRLPAVQGPPGDSPWKLPAGKMYAPPEVQGPPVPVEISSPAPEVQGPPLPVAETTEVAEGSVAAEAAAAASGRAAMASTAMVALGGAAVAAGAVAVALRAVAGTARQFDSAMMAMVGSFGEFSGELAATVAQQRALDVLNRVENARFAGESLAKYVESRGEIARSLQDVGVGVMDGLARHFEPVVSLLERLLGKAGDSQEGVSTFVQWLLALDPTKLAQGADDLSKLLELFGYFREEQKPKDAPDFFDLLNARAGGVAPPALSHNGRVYVDGAGAINGGSLAPGGMAAGVGGPIPGLEFP